MIRGELTMRCQVVMFVLALMCPQAVAEDFPGSVTDKSSITLEEVRAHSDAVFDAFAGEAGGPISKHRFLVAEIPAGILPGRTDRAVLERLFKVLDGDEDESVTRPEWNNRISRDLEAVDMNGDGKITVEELTTARSKIGVGDALEMLF